jgi:hypothetical protein
MQALIGTELAVFNLSYQGGDQCKNYKNLSKD